MPISSGDRPSPVSRPDRPAVVESFGSPQPTSDGRATNPAAATTSDAVPVLTSGRRVQADGAAGAVTVV